MWPSEHPPMKAVSSTTKKDEIAKGTLTTESHDAITPVGASPTAMSSKSSAPVGNKPVSKYW